jgi:hypothetical protein
MLVGGNQAAPPNPFIRFFNPLANAGKQKCHPLLSGIRITPSPLVGEGWGEGC